jgi:hypothetical protein
MKPFSSASNACEHLTWVHRRTLTLGILAKDVLVLPLFLVQKTAQAERLSLRTEKETFTCRPFFAAYGIIRKHAFLGPSICPINE